MSTDGTSSTTALRPTDWKRRAALGGLASVFVAVFFAVFHFGTRSTESEKKWAPAAEPVTARAPASVVQSTSQEAQPLAVDTQWDETRRKISESYLRPVKRSLALENSSMAAPVSLERTKFFSSLRYGDLKAVRRFIESSVIDPKTAAEGGSNALMQASYYGQLPIVKYLLSRKVDINAKDPNGATALIYAARAGHADIVKLLIKKGADDSVTLNTGETAVDVAKKFHYPKLAKYIQQVSQKRKLASH